MQLGMRQDNLDNLDNLKKMVVLTRIPLGDKGEDNLDNLDNLFGSFKLYRSFLKTIIDTALSSIAIANSILISSHTRGNRLSRLSRLSIALGDKAMMQDNLVKIGCPRLSGSLISKKDLQMKKQRRRIMIGERCEVAELARY